MKTLKAKVISLIAVLMGALLAFMSPVSIADITVYVNGSRPNVYQWPDSTPRDNSGGVLNGFFADDDRVAIDYPRMLGLLSGPGHVGYDTSVTTGTIKAVEEIKRQRAENPDEHINVGGESQGADASLRALSILESEGFDTSNMTWYVAGNVDNNDGGLMTRLLPWLGGVMIPFLNGTYGVQHVNPQYTNVVQVTNQYDGAADLPVYPLNVVALLNAFLGGFQYGRHEYNRTDMDDPNNVVTTSPNGLVTHILSLTPVGQLPITRPLLEMGVPQSVVTALDPFVRAVIETGYDRPDSSVPGTYPDRPVGFKLLPSPDKMVQDVFVVAKALAETVRQLGELAKQAVVQHFNPPAPPAQDSFVNQEPEGNSGATMRTSLAMSESHETNDTVQTEVKQSTQRKVEVVSETLNQRKPQAQPERKPLVQQEEDPKEEVTSNDSDPKPELSLDEPKDSEEPKKPETKLDDDQPTFKDDDAEEDKKKFESSLTDESKNDKLDRKPNALTNDEPSDTNERPSVSVSRSPSGSSEGSSEGTSGDAPKSDSSDNNE